jgi:hypothetical protein
MSARYFLHKEKKTIAIKDMKNEVAHTVQTDDLSHGVDG